MAASAGACIGAGPPGNNKRDVSHGRPDKARYDATASAGKRPAPYPTRVDGGDAFSGFSHARREIGGYRG